MSRKIPVFGITVFVILALIGFVVGSQIVEYRVNTRPLVEGAAELTHFVLPEEDSISVLVVGDSGSGTRNQYNVGIQMERRCRKKIPEAILHVGDLVYPFGVKSVEDEQWEKKVFKPYSGKCLDQVPIFPVLGNHDYDGDVASWLQMSERHPRWNYPSRHYSLEFPNIVTFYALDTQYPVNVREHGIPDFAEADTPWKIAYGHHPLTSQTASGGGHKGVGVRGYLLKKLLCNRVDAYLAGHTHSLEFDHIDDCEMMHFISGAGGADIYPVRDDITAEFARAEYGFLELEFFPEKMNVRFFNLEGEQYHKQIAKDSSAEDDQ